ncbi:DUF1501 domain-containing protein [Cocleimonas sp. KMM 6892]|uniref:DUF1501 domain-containing protein n=1 Tax=unclassified Cocleimonas TaxID=2639732 RepID=UPI002DBDA42A|nr:MULTISPECIES: DUF1501 domain-containing protein [unclassified Cocleimonas]MEB8431330.1 DUF1501 domain-containing protein [Cocleimonas sp. KMM 6892]MEC4713898.1 DUF1501 domain-containing protein [Cocleimonas sp. KMM 6895]MEC4743229.1 DUF1501 domain-containing protein [Cocleimonas sp. KMM 6896]
MNRRDFLQYASLVPLAGMAPGAFAAGQGNRPDQILLMVELKGGNDGLNTLIPFRDADYHRARPTLRVKNGIPLRDNMAMNPYLKNLLPLWKEGHMAWIQGVGYSNPSRSHFHSIDIWETASTKNNESRGWLSRVLPPRNNAVNGIVLGDNNLGPMSGANSSAVAMEDPKTFLRQTKYLNKKGFKPANSSLAHMLNVQNQINTAAQELGRIHKGKRSPVRFPPSRFGRKLEQVTQMIINGMDTPVYKVSLEGFDTHASQVDQHNNLMNHLGGGLQAFSQAMKRAGLWNNVMVITYSEFGRRVAENNSGGTDHGSAAPHFAIGGRVRGGMYGKQPSLSPDKLHDGDLIHTVDFREVYATLAQRWWRRPNPWEKQFRPIPFV